MGTKSKRTWPARHFVREHRCRKLHLRWPRLMVSHRDADCSAPELRPPLAATERTSLHFLSRHNQTNMMTTLLRSSCHGPPDHSRRASSRSSHYSSRRHMAIFNHCSSRRQVLTTCMRDFMSDDTSLTRFLFACWPVWLLARHTTPHKSATTSGCSLKSASRL